MPSTFFGLTIATSGLYTAQAALNTTAHNISNEKTTGYTRQVANQQAQTALRAYTTYGMLGSGVEVTSVSQIRDAYYDIKYRNNAALLGEQTVKYNYLLQIEDVLNEEKVETGFTTEYENFFNALNDLKNNASSNVIRDEVVNYASSLADFLNGAVTTLTKLQQEMNTEISNKVDQINTLSEQIASLTKQINTIELSGATANDLRDRRAVLLDNLSAIVPIEVNEEVSANGKTDFSVKVEGYTLVDNFNAKSLKVVSRTDKVNSTDITGLYDIYINYDEATGTGTKLDVQSSVSTGELRALFDLRDGNNGEVDSSNPSSEAVNFKGIPYYLQSMNEFITALATEFNNVHSTGYNLYGDSTEDIDFFVIDSYGRLSVNQDIVKDVSLMAASKNPIQDGAGDGSLAEELYQLKDAKIINNTTSQEYLKSIVSDAAIDTKKSKTFYSYYTNIQNTVKNQRLSISGVDTDEESVNLVKFQEAYNLSAKMIQVMSEIYDKLINETGV